MNPYSNQTVNLARPSETLTPHNLQAYVNQLTTYIADSNAKYHKNMTTIKHFYEEQIANIGATVESHQESLLLARNQNITLRDLLLNHENKIKTLEDLQTTDHSQMEQVRASLEVQRQRTENVYLKMDAMRKISQEEAQTHRQSLRECQQTSATLVIKLKEKESDLAMANKEILSLQDQLQQRYSLPQRLQEQSISLETAKLQLQQANGQKQSVQMQYDYQINELQALRRENEQLRVKCSKISSQSALTVELALKKQKEHADSHGNRLQTEHDALLLDKSASQRLIAQLKQQVSGLEAKVQECQQAKQAKDKEIIKATADKDAYLNEFKYLKAEYDQVIARLEAAMMQYQSKNWQLEQDNQDLNVQLDGMQELLRELKAMNQLLPVQAQYRQMAQLELMAARKPATKPAQELPQQESKADLAETEWERLLQEIEGISV